jgi:multidrug efflux pump subunit AcrA (membrane-fusion protein)
LPAEVPYVPKQRRLGYIVYALLSGVYSYTVLYIVARFTGNFVRNFSPEWGFIPEIGVALLIFRSRIRLLVNFMKFLYLDKKDRLAAWFTPRYSTAVALAVVVILALPLWHDSAAGRFVLEPVHRAVVRALVPGTVVQLDVHEGQQVAAGDPLAVLRNIPLVSDFEGARSRLTMASDRVNAASLHHLGYGEALKEREQLAAQVTQLSQRNEALQLMSPISGTVVSPRVGDMLGAYLQPGEQLLEVADLSSLRARIYVSEWEMYKIRAGASARVQVQGFLRKWDANVKSISSGPTEMDPGLRGEGGLNGVNPPHFYLVDLEMENPGFVLRPGMTGVARVYGKRRSLAGMGWEAISNFWGRKLW